MKIAIISDIHSNLEALRAVQKDMRVHGIDAVYCLGDIVGYGPFPKECLSIVREKATVILKGNHEDSTCHPKRFKKDLTPYAWEGIQYSRRKLVEKDVCFLSSLSETQVIQEFNLSLAHSAFTKPSAWKYIYEEDEARNELESIPTRICMIGHTHIPFVFGSQKGLHEFLPDNFVLDKDQKYLINVGSVGQPRDGDCRASYGILEFIDGQVLFNLQRVFYDISKTERAIRKAGLSLFLSERLFRGE